MTTEETLEDLLGDEVFTEIKNDGVKTAFKGILKTSKVFNNYYCVNDLHFHSSKVTKFRVLEHVIIEITL